MPELEEREDLQRLLVSSLDYSRDGPSRIVLSKLLTNTTKVWLVTTSGIYQSIEAISVGFHWVFVDKLVHVCVVLHCSNL